MQSEGTDVKFYEFRIPLTRHFFNCQISRMLNLLILIPFLNNINTFNVNKWTVNENFKTGPIGKKRSLRFRSIWPHFILFFFFLLVHSKHCYFVYLEYGISYCSPNLYYSLTLNEKYISHIINQNKLRLINQKLCNRMTLGPLYKGILLTSGKTEYHIW